MDARSRRHIIQLPLDEQLFRVPICLWLKEFLRVQSLQWSILTQQLVLSYTKGRKKEKERKIARQRDTGTRQERVWGSTRLDRTEEKDSERVYTGRWCKWCQTETTVWTVAIFLAFPDWRLDRWSHRHHRLGTLDHQKWWIIQVSSELRMTHHRRLYSV